MVSNVKQVDPFCLYRESIIFDLADLSADSARHYVCTYARDPQTPIPKQADIDPLY
jgi:hypothetical protein